MGKGKQKQKWGWMMEGERERLGMEGKEGKGGRDAGQDKRINTEGSK